MSETEVLALRAEAIDVMARLRVAERSCGGPVLLESLKFHHVLQRQSRHDVLRTIARADGEGVFAERGVTAKAAVADVLLESPRRAKKLVGLAGAMFPTNLAGIPKPPKLEATAAALGSYAIGLEHAEVIDAALNTKPAERLDPVVWAAAEKQLAEWAHDYRASELAKQAREFLEALDQDGAEPDETGRDNLPNELHLYPHRGGGGRIKGELDAHTYEVLARALEALRKPPGDADKSLPERDADALGELCTNCLDEGQLPEQGGERPHVLLVLTLEQLRRNRGTILEYGGQLSAALTRMLLCDSAITPVVLGENSEPLYVGRSRRCVTPALRKALIARDRGCAKPGCDRRPHHCQSHHIGHWAQGGRTDLNNMILLCHAHHKEIHESGWIVRIVDGYPEFIPPKWLDNIQRPRRKPPPLDPAFP